MFALFVTLSRADEAPASLGTSASQEVHKVAGCEIGYSYDIWNMNCGKAAAFYKPADCTDDDASDANCVAAEITGADWHYYDDKTTTTSETKDLMDTAVSAEGSGWGTSVSASADYMQSHSLTSYSVTYWLGMSGEAYKEKFQNVQKLELTAAASTQLADNWETFIETYGTHYVSELIYTTQFIGSVQISSKTETAKSDLSVAMSMSYEGLCKASGTAKFDEATSGTSGSLSTKLSAQWDGAALEWQSAADGVTQLNQTYADWQKKNVDDPKSNSVVTKMIYRSLYDIEQVQEIVIANYNDTERSKILSEFYMTTPTATTMQTITEDYLMAKTQRNSLTLYQSYACSAELELDTKIQTYIDTLTTHINLLEHMTDDELWKRQDEIDNNDYTWFVGRNLAYTPEIEDALAGCAPPTPAPTADLGCMDLAYNGKCGPNHGKKLCSSWFNSAYRYCNYDNNEGTCESTPDNRASGQSKFYDEDNIRDACNPYTRASVVDSTCKQLDSSYSWRGPDPQVHGLHPVCFNSLSRARKRSYTCGHWCCIPGSEWRCETFGCPDWFTCGESTLTDRLGANIESKVNDADNSMELEAPYKILQNLVERNFVSTQE